MSKGRVEAFSDGVVAIIITIMVLGLVPPGGTSIADLAALAPVLLAYVLSFVNVGIYWNNHHHLFQAVHSVNGRVLWANLHLLFWLSLMPFATAWMGERGFAPVPVATYGIVLLMAGVAYLALELLLVRAQPAGTPLGEAVGDEVKGKVSLLLYAIGAPLALVAPAGGLAVFALVAMLWFVPDSRIERALGR
jgi:uncharacterized membrane protein